MKKPKVTEYGDWATWVGFEVMANYQVRVILTNDIAKSSRGRLSSGPDGNADAFCYHVEGDGKSYIFLPLDAPECTFVHECWHVIYRMFHYCGVTDFDDEVTAYHLDHLVEKVFEFKNAVKSSITKEASNGQPVCGTSSTKCD
jgi:hypothetical protein